jgi:LmbE family N-acetylglucosaminyl deacetylase
MNRSLIVSPHPDDAEYSMSGTVLLQQATDNFSVFTLSSGGDNDDTTGIERFFESISFWKKFSYVNHMVPFNSSEKSISDMTEWQLVSQFDSLVKDFDTVYVPPLEDNHFEHRKVSEAMRAAVRGKAITLIEYYTPSTRHTWQPNMFVDITKKLDTKIELMQLFSSQLDRFYFSNQNIDIFHEDYFCRLRGLDKVEKFKIVHRFL